MLTPEERTLIAQALDAQTEKIKMLEGSLLVIAGVVSELAATAVAADQTKRDNITRAFDTYAKAVMTTGIGKGNKSLEEKLPILKQIVFQSFSDAKDK